MVIIPARKRVSFLVGAMTVLAVILILILASSAKGAQVLTRVRRGFAEQAHGYGYGSAPLVTYGGSSYSPDLSIGTGVAGALAADSTQQNLLSLYAQDLRSAFQVGYAAQAIVNAARTSAAAGAKNKGGHGK